MSDVVFVDSNILVYAHDRDAGSKREKAARALDRLWDERVGRLSAQVLDPLDRDSHSVVARTLYVARRYQEAVAALSDVVSLDAAFMDTNVFRGFAYYGLGDLQSARATCETPLDYWGNQYCLALTYDRLGRHADAQAELAKMKAAIGVTAAYQYATVYAQWAIEPRRSIGSRRRCEYGIRAWSC